MVIANPELSFSITSLLTFGTVFAWKVVFFFYIWAFISLKIPSKIFYGPPTPNGYIPKYSANGLQFYLFSLIVFLIYVILGPGAQMCVWIYEDFGSIIQGLRYFTEK